MSTTALGSRLVIGGTHSGVGKTTVATGLMAALRRAGHRPAGAKVGPDFIDPGYHSLATGRPPRNLDPWLCGPDAMAPLAARAADGADLLVIEGVMGLFDGAGDGTTSSTADLARLLDAPVVLVVDASAMSTSAAALVHGYRTWDPAVRVAGVILNRVGSPTHEALLREALADSDVEVVGALPRDDRLTWRDRHLGLVPVVESPEAVEASIEVLAELIAEHVDLQAIVGLASASPRHRAVPTNLPQRSASSR
ncbi:MAG: cobyrinate a,c-diamide synthase, partial [Acidimicrobiales bacterium]